MQQTHFYSNGKLLLSGEYLVLHGAKALALPLKFGQDLLVEHHPEAELGLVYWRGYENKMLWFEAQISKVDFSIQKTSDILVAKKLIDVLQKTKSLNPHFLSGKGSISIQTNLDFNKEWGLGSSSTLINNIAKWAEVDPYRLLKLSFGGSGYDIACAEAEQAIFFTKTSEGIKIENANFYPDFKQYLFFVYLGRKQDSSESIREFNKLKQPPSSVIKEISDISIQLAKSSSLEEFNHSVRKHEEIISSILKMPTIKQNRFPDFKGEIKSLGAWGGDFILVTSQKDISEVKKYFSNYKLETVFNYDDLVKQQ